MKTELRTRGLAGQSVYSKIFVTPWNKALTEKTPQPQEEK